MALVELPEQRGRLVLPERQELQALTVQQDPPASLVFQVPLAFKVPLVLALPELRVLPDSTEQPGLQVSSVSQVLLELQVQPAVMALQALQV